MIKESLPTQIWRETPFIWTVLRQPDKPSNYTTIYDCILGPSEHPDLLTGKTVYVYTCTTFFELKVSVLPLYTLTPLTVKILPVRV